MRLVRASSCAALVVSWLLWRVPLRGAEPLLRAESVHQLFNNFSAQERSFLGSSPKLDWSWFASNIPLLDIPDKGLEEIYYFRWYSFQKHLRQTPAGYIFDEFLDDVPWAGKYNAINDAAGHHIREARWLRNQQYVEQYARFWFSPAGEPRRYSLAAADAAYSIYLANRNEKLATELLPQLIENYEVWKKTHYDANGLFWQIDDRDGMEDSIGGSGYRPTINSYMYGDAAAISKIAALTGDGRLSEKFAAEATTLRATIEAKLWNPGAQFYETLPRKEGATRANVRELIGYVPWYFGIPHENRSVAWKQLNDPHGFAGKFGPTTAERRSPRFRFFDPHECLWNGPSWPFATTQTLVALANLLNGPTQNVIGTQQYFDLLLTYARSQHIRTAKGETIPWIDEDLDPDTGEWIARNILEARRQPPKNRGRYYNHSGFADVVITGLLGVRPEPGETLSLHPLLPEDRWSYFALDGLPYHGHILSIFYDKDGSKYHHGAGFHVLSDTKQIYVSKRPGSIAIPLIAANSKQPSQEAASSARASPLTRQMRQSDKTFAPIR